MTNKIHVVSEIIENELFMFDEMIRRILKNDNSLLNEVIDFVFKTNGKKIRPALVFLSAKAAGEPNHVTLETAVALELLHTASLLHDDVVDESLQRRGQPSVNAIYGNKVSVLAGDFMLASSLDLAITTNNLPILALFTKLGKNLAKGEIQQLFLAKEDIIDEADYFDVIRQKTSALFSVCASAGALSVCASPKELEFLTKIGENMGIIFQLKDDLFDYYANDSLGKPTCKDIREGNITLPLIYAIRKTQNIEYKKIIQKIHTKNFTDSDVYQLIDFAKENGGIQYVKDAMEKLKINTLELISQIKAVEIQKAFVSFLDFFMVREI